MRQRELKRPGRNIVIALLLACATFYLYSLFLANTSFLHSGDQIGARQEGVLTIESCEPNWLLFGARSVCSGTIVPEGAQGRSDEFVKYVNKYSDLRGGAVGTAVPAKEVSGVFGMSWKAVPVPEAGFVPSLLIGPLAIAACSHGVFAAGLAVRWCFGVVRSSLAGARR
ncbi:hypothetical protein GIY23_06325 [Allosaccharopolyspora coralli]|uniref:Uncharacterized protein n=1 Tax=Allosaccharopolyspora coralli TaxID=2665642 RepID=A0A5Q3Q3L2_9PSEU|nr:hypothetical protein [Allosaccharopolyspora coralli]QGK69198.1 hypothetical protein GIY23_06325 [Allosaccharopolyspora coralli]